MVLTLVPGWGHVYWGRELLGLAIFTAFAVAGFSLLNGLFIYIGEGRGILIYGAACLHVGIAAWAWTDIFRRTSPSRVRREEEEREHNLREGMIAYLRGDFDEAQGLFLACSEADPVDPEALFRLGVVCSRAGKAREAVTWLRRTRKYDLEGKWNWEVEQELLRIRRQGGREPPAAAPSDAGSTPAAAPTPSTTPAAETPAENSE